MTDINLFLEITGLRLANLCSLAYGTELVLHRLKPGAINSLALSVTKSAWKKPGVPRYDMQLLGYYDSPEKALTAMAAIDLVLPYYGTDLSIVKGVAATNETTVNNLVVYAVTISIQVADKSV